MPLFYFNILRVTVGKGVGGKNGLPLSYHNTYVQQPAVLTTQETCSEGNQYGLRKINDSDIGKR